MGGGSRRSSSTSRKRKCSSTTGSTSSNNNNNGPRKKPSRPKTTASSNNNDNKTMWSSANKSNKKNSNNIENNAEAMFQELTANEDDLEMLSMEGIALLGEKLNLDVESDIRILVLLWKVQATKPGALPKTEWMEAARNGTLDVSNKWESLREQVPAWDIGFLTGSEFKDFYKFCFQFNRQGTHRTLDRDLVVALLKLVLKDRVLADRLESFCEFLENLDATKQQQYNRITLDQWTSFWDFCVECEDLQSYDESTSAWPVLIDEYVEFMEEKLQQK